MRILVTGGAGFIGSHLCRKLLDEGHFVFCMDNLRTGMMNNVTELRSHDNFAFFFHDVCEPINLEVDQIYNLACPASPVQYQINAVRTLKTSVLGGINILECAVRSGASVLHASTSEVYGDPLESPQGESYNGNVNTTGPRACYDEGKRCLEALSASYISMHDVDSRIVRIFNTYGPRMSTGDGRVVSSFIWNILRGEPVSINGDGLQTRSFCFVSDLVDGLIKVMNNPSRSLGPINLGNPHEISVRELASIISELADKPLEINWQTLPKDDPKIRCPDISFARSLLSWEPTVDLKTGLEKTITYFRGHLNDIQ